MPQKYYKLCNIIDLSTPFCAMTMMVESFSFLVPDYCDESQYISPLTVETKGPVLVRWIQNEATLDCLMEKMDNLILPNPRSHARQFELRLQTCKIGQRVKSSLTRKFDLILIFAFLFRANHFVIRRSCWICMCISS